MDCVFNFSISEPKKELIKFDKHKINGLLNDKNFFCNSDIDKNMKYVITLHSPKSALILIVIILICYICYNMETDHPYSEWFFVYDDLMTYC